MKLSGTFVYQASECRQGIKDPSKYYREASLLSGMDQLRCIVNEDLFDKVLPGIPQYTNCNCTFEYNPTYSTMRLVDIHPVK